jgi:hypothetical protein
VQPDRTGHRSPDAASPRLDPGSGKTPRSKPGTAR